MKKILDVFFSYLRLDHSGIQLDNCVCFYSFQTNNNNNNNGTTIIQAWKEKLNDNLNTNIYDDNETLLKPMCRLKWEKK